MNGTNWNRGLAALLALCLALSLLPSGARAAEVASGTCGDGLTWTLDDAGTLTVSGTGEMGPYSASGSVPWDGRRSEIREAVIEEGAASVSAYAFYGCINLTSVSISNTVTSIMMEAFDGCTALTSITIPDSVTYIGTNAFMDCSSLTSITIPGSVTSMGEWIFYGCTNLTSVVFQEGVPAIETGIFTGCTNLTSVSIPDSVTRIGNGAFTRCGKLASVTLPAHLTSLGGSAFEQCESLTSVTIPEGVTSLGTNLFQGCTRLASVSIPKSVTSIGQYAFDGCGALTGITIPPDVTEIGEGAFQNCTGLTTVEIPAKTVTAGTGVFSGCGNLTDVYCWNENPAYTASGLGLTGSNFWISGPANLTCSDPAAVANPTLTITSDRPFNPAAFAGRAFPSAVSAGTGTTGLTPANARLDPNDAANKTLLLSFDGSSQGGDVTISLDTTAFAGPENFTFTDIWTLTFPAALEATGSLAITKVIHGGGAEAQEKTYRFTVTGPNGYSRTIAIDGPRTAELTNLSLGTYTVTEDQAGAAISGYTLSVSDGFTAVVEANEAADIVITNTYTVSASPAPGPSSSGGGGGGGGGSSRPSSRPVATVDDILKTEEGPEIVISGTGESDLQDIVKDGEHIRWIDRVNLPQYAVDLYTVLCIGGDNDTLYDVLIKDEYNTLRAGAPAQAAGTARVESVLTLMTELDRPLSSGGMFQTQHFTEASFDVVDTRAGDRAVDYTALKEGDVVRTATFNGIYATKIRKDGNPDYDEDVKRACGYVTTAFQAFDRDHPEVFWLSGKSKVRMVTASVKENGTTRRESYIFFTLADQDGFTVRDASCSTQSEIEAQIARRDAAVSGILATVTGASVNEKVRDLNRWLTEHNQYNTSADLRAIGNAPHECLSALTGSEGTSGPVCDGYARAFKVLCDQLDIPCVLVDGYARPSAESKGEFHMWNSVQMPDAQWYGVDVTWNDPSVAGAGAKSGRENERFLLVGADTVVLGLKFSDSHPPVNRAVDGGVSFINGPTLSLGSFNPMAALPFLPFADVGAGDWFCGAVEYVYEKGIMNGVSETRFAPQTSVTRAMMAAILYRMEGSPDAGNREEAVFSDVPSDLWCAGAVRWAKEQGVISGYSDGRFGPQNAVTREQLAVMLWHCAGSPGSSQSLEGFTDQASVGGYAREAVSWAVETGILSGSGGALNPKNAATRAQIAAVIQRFCERSKGSEKTEKA